MISNSQTANRAVGLTGSIVGGMTSISSLFSFGPVVFIILNQQEILKNVVLVGNQTNLFVLEILQNSYNPFDLLFDILNSKIDSSKHSKNLTTYEKSGYDLRPSILRISKDLLQLTIIVSLILGVSLLIFIIFMIFKANLI